MPDTAKDSRQSVRLCCALIALLSFGYLVEIYFMGAPDFDKHSHRTYYRDKDPLRFWSEFAAYAAIGIAASYVSVYWKTGSSMVVAVEEWDRKRVASLGQASARQGNNYRRFSAFFFGAIMLVLLVFLAVGLIRQ